MSPFCLTVIMVTIPCVASDAEDVIAKNQALIESITTFHAKAVLYQIMPDGKRVQIANTEQWKKGKATKTIELLTPPNGPSRKTIARTLDGLTHIMYLPEYPSDAQVIKTANMMMSGSIFGRMGFYMADQPKKRSLTPREMLAAGYEITSSKVTGEQGRRLFSVKYSNECEITLAEEFNYIVVRREYPESFSEARDIRQVAPGIFLPFKINTTSTTRNPQETKTTEMIVQTASVNQPILDNDLRLSLPANSTMTDFTTGKTYFVTADGGFIKEKTGVKFDHIIEKTNEPIILDPSPLNEDHSQARYYAMTIILLIILALLGYVGMRKMKYRLAVSEGVKL